MVKRLFCLFLCLSLLPLSACGGEGGQSYTLSGDVRTAVQAYNAADTRLCAFAFDMREEGADEPLVFIQGSAAYKCSSPVALSGRVTQVKDGEGTTSDIYYKAGAYYSAGSGGSYYIPMDSADMLSAYFCLPVPLPDEAGITGLRTAETDGKKYVYTASAAEALPSLADNLYGFCALRKPAREKTECREAEYSYVIASDGSLQGFKVTASFTLHDTAPYYPAYSVPESALAKSFSISLEITVKQLGGSVQIYSPDTSEFTFLG